MKEKELKSLSNEFSEKKRLAKRKIQNYRENEINR